MRRHVLSLLVISLAVPWMVSCTRNAAGPRLRLTIPTSSEQSSLATGAEILRHVVINLRESAGSAKSPKVYEFELPSSRIVLPGQSLDLVIDKDIPSSKTLYVQYLGVFESATGTRRFSYGDVTVDSSVSGDIAANISAAMFGSSAKEGRIQGRYFNTPTSGPSGVVVISFQPPGTVPAMDIERTDMVAGWFDFFVLEGAAGATTEARLTYRLQETNEALFSHVNLGSFPNGAGASQIRFVKPTTYRMDDPTEPPRTVPAADYVIGFFQKPGSGANLEGKRVCYAGTQQGLPGVYRDSSLSGYLYYYPFTVNTAYLRLAATLSGQSASLLDIYTDNNPECDPALGDAMKVFPNRLVDKGGDSIGIRGPFALLEPMRAHDGYATMTFDSENTKIDLKWRYLPGVTVGAAGSISGVSIWGKFQPNGGGGNYDNKGDCSQQMKKRGFTQIGERTSASGGDQTFAFAGTSAHPVGALNWHNWELALCPYRGSGTARTYFNSVAYARSGGMDNLYGYGWGNMTSTPANNSFTADYGGGYGFLSTVNSTLSANYTSFMTSTLTGAVPVAGSEVLLIVMSRGNSEGCGVNVHGDPIGAGHFEFARVLLVDAGPTYKIAKGTFLDGLGAGSTLSATPHPDTPHCRVQMVNVPHFENLTVGSAGLTLDSIYNSNIWGAGGVIALRVNGTLTMNGAISVSGRGYPGAGAVGAWGDGYMGHSEDSAPTGSGGQSVNLMGAGGGGGWASGQAGDNAGNLSAGGFGMDATSFGNLRLLMGGGGGVHFDGSPYYGGDGGGIIFVAARNIVYNSSAGFNADGVSPNGAGSGGGSVNVLASRITSSEASNGSLVFTAMGSANTSGIPTIMGHGGGGYVSLNYCQLGPATGAPVFEVMGGDEGNPALSGAFNSVTAFNYNLCR